MFARQVVFFGIIAVLWTAVDAVQDGPRIYSWFRKQRVPRMSPRDRLEYAVEETIGRVLSEVESKYLKIVVGLPRRHLDERVILVAYLEKDLADIRHSVGTSLYTVGTKKMAWVSMVGVDGNLGSHVMPRMQALARKVHEWDIPELHPEVSLYAILLKDEVGGEELRLRMTAKESIVAGNTRTPGRELDRVEILLKIAP